VKNSTKAEITEKKSNRKAAIGFVVMIAIIFPVVWFGLDFLATEYPITQSYITISGKDRVLKFSEKKRGYSNKIASGERQSGISHHGYFLELLDSINNKSLHKLKFKSPVHKIQNKPKMYVSSNGTIWLVSTTRSYQDDERGFILKFLIENDNIKKEEYELDETYGIREIDGNKVILNKGSDFYQAYSVFVGGIYFDLETEKIVDDRKK
jgi:hypothetical protein